MMAKFKGSFIPQQIIVHITESQIIFRKAGFLLESIWRLLETFLRKLVRFACLEM